MIEFRPKRIELPVECRRVLRAGRKPFSAARAAEQYFRRYRDPELKVSLPRVRFLEQEEAA